MIAMQFAGQIGNQMVEYCVAKIIAERTGLAYQPSDDFFKKDGSPIAWSDKPLFRMAPTRGRILQSDPPGWQMIDAMHWLDLDAIDGSRPVSVRGFFQRYELLRPWKNRIRKEWLSLSPWRIGPTDPEAVYVHVRRTDYVDIGEGRPPDTTRQERASTPEEFARCIAEFSGAKRLVLVTDDPTGAAAMPWPLPFTVQSAAWDVDFLTLASARWLVCSCSTFSWWAGWLGHAERIAIPVFPGTYWHNGLGAVGPDRPDFPNLYPDDEAERWRWLA